MGSVEEFPTFVIIMLKKEKKFKLTNSKAPIQYWPEQ